MENTVNKLLILPFEQGDDTMGPCKIGFQKQSLKHVKKLGFHLVQEKAEKQILICVHCKSPEYHNVLILMAN